MDKLPCQPAVRCPYFWSYILVPHCFLCPSIHDLMSLVPSLWLLLVCNTWLWICVVFPLDRYDYFICQMLLVKYFILSSQLSQLSMTWFDTLLGKLFECMLVLNMTFILQTACMCIGLINRWNLSCCKLLTLYQKPININWIQGTIYMRYVIYMYSQNLMCFLV